MRSKLLTILALCFLTLHSNAQSLTNVKVTAFENISRQRGTANKKPVNSLFRRDYFRLHVDSLSLLIKNKPPKGKIVLFIDGIPFEDLEPEFIDSTSVVFLFQKHEDPNRKEELKAWTYFYKKPRQSIIQNKTISVGYMDSEPVASDARIDLVIIHQLWYKVGIGLIIALLGILVYLSAKTNLLRDGASLPENSRPFSLARTQFTFWLFLVSSAYIFLWISTGEMPVITNSSLILIGISGTTSLIAKVIENSQVLSVTPDREAGNFIVDLLSDEKGISIHRLQMLVFTIIIGVIFIHDVIVIFEMPEFDDGLLLLMGISNGTYAGFKSTENSATAPVG